MNTLLGSITQDQWEAHLAGLRELWSQLVKQSGALRASQEAVLRHALSGAGLSRDQADRTVALYLEGADSEDGPKNLAEFVRHNDPEELPPPTIQEISALIASLQEEWLQMFTLLKTTLPSPRGQALAEARTAPAQPLKSLDAAFIWPVNDIAQMHSPDEARPVASISLDGDLEKEGQPAGPEAVGLKISRAILESLYLQREIAKLKAFWTNDVGDLAAFVTRGAPQPAPVVRRSWWRPSTWSRRTGEESEAVESVTPWREKPPAYVPTGHTLAFQLRAWRAQTEKEAEALRTAEAGWTERVSTIGKELEARRETERRHPPLSLDPESASQGELAEATTLLSRADSNIQNHQKALEWVADALANLGPSSPAK